MRILTFLVLLFAAHQVLAGKDLSWQLVSSEVKYKVSYTFKTVEGVGKTAKGKGLCIKKKCEFLVAIPVKDFDSEDSNRDSRMIEVTQAALNPLVKFKVETPQVNFEKNFKANVEINFAGQTHKYKAVEFKVSKQGDTFVVDSSMKLELSDYKIERPKLLGIPISNELPLTIHAAWKQN